MINNIKKNKIINDISISIFNSDQYINLNNYNDCYDYDFVTFKDFVSDISNEDVIRDYNSNSNIINKSNISVDANTPILIPKLHPWFITGFTDGEGCFSFTIKPGKTHNLKVSIEYKVSQNASSKEVLYGFIDYFKVGKVCKESDFCLKYHVQDLVSIRDRIIPHFKQYPLKTSKALDFNDWSKVVELITNKKHYTVEGINAIIDLKNCINNSRPVVDRWKYLDSQDIHIHPNWIQGFIDGEGSFQYPIYDVKRDSGNGTRVSVNPTLEIAQSNHHVAILEAIIKFLESGCVKPKYDKSSITETFNSRSVNRYVTWNEDKVIALVDKYPLKTRKQMDYIDWKKLISIQKKGLHITDEGRAIMNTIKSTINRNRGNIKSETALNIIKVSKIKQET